MSTRPLLLVLVLLPLVSAPQGKVSVVGKELPELVVEGAEVEVVDSVIGVLELRGCVVRVERASLGSARLRGCRDVSMMETKVGGYLYIESSSNVRLEDLRIPSSNTSALWIVRSRDVSMARVSIDRAGDHGFRIVGSDNVDLSDAVVGEVAASALDLTSSDHVRVANLEVLRAKYGLHIRNSSSVLVSGFRLTMANYGLYVHRSRDVSLEDVAVNTTRKDAFRASASEALSLARFSVASSNGTALSVGGCRDLNAVAVLVLEARRCGVQVVGSSDVTFLNLTVVRSPMAVYVSGSSRVTVEGLRGGEVKVCARVEESSHVTLRRNECRGRVVQESCERCSVEVPPSSKV